MAVPQARMVRTPYPRPLPRGRLLDIIARLTVGDMLVAGSEAGYAERWLAGLGWEPNECSRLLTDNVVVCGTNDFPDLSNVECQDPIDQTPFALYDVFNGSTLEYRIEEIDSILRERYELIRSAAFARELVGGAASGGRSLSSTAHLTAGGATATSVEVALYHLENDLGETMNGGQGLIHLPPGLLHSFVTQGGLQLVDGQWQTPTGHRVVADAGYVGAPEPSGGSAASATQAWVYASGPVRWAATDDFLGDNGSEYTSITRNQIQRILAGYGILVFDPCPVTAVLVTIGDNA